MFRSRAPRPLAAIPIALALLTLTACATPTGGESTDNGANDAAAARFVTCLSDEGQTAKIIDSGQVGLLMPDAPGDAVMGTLSDDSTSASAGEGEETALSMVFSDDDGTWLASTAASGYPEEGGQRAAWEKCGEAVPEFTQPEPDMSAAEGAKTMSISPEELIKSGLAFASCARENGFTDFADPDSDGMLELPVGITEDEARTLLESCAETTGDMPPMFTSESIESAEFDWFALMSEYFEGAFAAATAMPSEGDE